MVSGLSAARRTGGSRQAELRQRIRGHRAREHVTRRERTIARGELPISSADYAFLKKQRARSPEIKNRIVGINANGQPILANETPAQRFERAKKAYLRLSRDERDELRAAQSRMARRKKYWVKHHERGEMYMDEEYYEIIDGLDDDIITMYNYSPMT
jgi:hypothetical protein